VTGRCSVLQAACVYSLIRSLRIGFRRICCVSMSVTVAGGPSRSSSGTCCAMPWLGPGGTACRERAAARSVRQDPQAQSRPDRRLARRGAQGGGDRDPRPRARRPGAGGRRLRGTRRRSSHPVAGRTHRSRDQPGGAQRTRWCRRSGPAVPGSDEQPMPLSAHARDFPAEPRPAWPVRSENRLLPAHFTLRSCINKPMGGVLGKGIDHWSSNAAAGRRRGAARSRPFLTSPPRPGRDSRASTDPTCGQNGHIKNDLER
jgi:hypothetical protein